MLILSFQSIEFGTYSNETACESDVCILNCIYNTIYLHVWATVFVALYRNAGSTMLLALKNFA